VIARKPAVAFIFITLVLDILGIGLIIPITPRLIESLQRTNVTDASHTYGLLVALYSLMQFVGAPLLGSLSDRFGRRRVILLSLLGSGLDYFLLAYAPTIEWFFVGRIISGLTGSNFSAATAYIADITPPEKRAANFGLIGVAFGLGFILGPALGGLLGDIGLRMPFIVAGALTLLNALYGWMVLPESLAPENRRAFSWVRSNPVGALLHLRKYPMVFGLAGTYFLIYMAHQALPSTWVLYTEHRYHWDAKQTGASLAVVGLMAAIVQGGLTRVVVARVGERKAAILGLAVAALGYAGYGLATEGWMIYVILVLASVGGITGPAVQALVSRNVRADEQGGVQGSLASLSGISGFIGPPIAAGLFGHFVNTAPGVAFFFSAALIVVALLLAVRSFQRNPVASPAAEAVPAK
jgi:DHA1 family tetracycline resistance protein-like MFS transporter